MSHLGEGRGFENIGLEKTHLFILKPFESKQIRLATGTTGKIETPTFKIFRREAGCLWFDIFIIALDGM